jgi:hypothetical protein
MAGYIYPRAWKRAAKQLLILFPPARRYFASKDALAADFQRLTELLCTRTFERDQALAAAEKCQREYETAKAEVQRLVTLVGDREKIDSERERLAAELSVTAAQRDELAATARQLRMTAAIFIAQRDEARRE